jgi:predicted GH43/DUF377 family glycosyl hydrolase
VTIASVEATPEEEPVQVTRAAVRLRPDPRRVLLKQFLPGATVPADAEARARSVLERVLALPEPTVTGTLEATRSRFAHRHRDLEGTLERQYRAVAGLIEGIDDGLSPARRLLIGAYFTHEYAIEAAALSNPSLVPAPDQDGVGPGEQRFVMSLRAIGEGHFSSIEFRTGVVDDRAGIHLDEAASFVTDGRHEAPLYDRKVFRAKLAELGVPDDVADEVLAAAPPRFTMADLESSLSNVKARGLEPAVVFETTRIAHWVAASNYVVTFPPDAPLSERVIFPSGPSESQGMEDARFVRFEDDDGAVTYYAIYTAFDGYQILPQLIETGDFLSFRIATLNGMAASNKGIALFPRRIEGRFAALSRQDNERNFIMFSDDVRTWDDQQPIQVPRQPWELVQLGNCGSPLETEAGWLVLTHGVGPLRQYAIGAILLDPVDPRRVIGHLDRPLLAPADDERDGYVPNVVYSCGGMIHGRHVVIPYGFADVGAGVLTVRLDDLLARLTAG